ncbi:hypothetical protein C8D87_102388 [Lentzea atacamensis]|uniref:Uncharacterized protein n=1 Tax=Lentzea atacamensis TaxID=531938 RepID=A0ABX9EFA0_9PSEU|nr:hypothetical protein C8D87_102388 [Lentzea atacamensis]
MPQTLVRLRIALGTAWLSLIVGEQINADAGLGFLINNAREFLRTDVVVVGLVVYALLGLTRRGRQHDVHDPFDPAVAQDFRSAGCRRAG